MPGYLEIRIANYFEVGHDSQLVLEGRAVPTLKIELVN
jgi:hypothetical protein